ncbi:MAG: LytTR family transcriptional regulator DNA-binding domain-containing protein [Ruminiclostridium sp.]|nr:LytTR family transcriptional regulator DNA-binding domain-containing protein [Ruminiclostridium sp.]
MILKLIEDIKIKQTQVTIEYKEKDIKVDKLIDFVTHLDELDDNIMASCDGQIHSLNIRDILYIESVDRKTFCYTYSEVYESNLKLYEIEEKYQFTDMMRISKSTIVNLKKIDSLKPDFGGKILATMENGEKLYISRQYSPLLKEKLGIGGKRL